MTAIAISHPGAPDVLVAQQRPLPVPAATDVLIKVEAAGINRPDLMQRSGMYPPPPGASDLPGLEVAGEIVGLGAAVVGFGRGDKVMSLVSGGGYAEYCVAPESHLMRIPAGFSMVEAAAVPETLMTVWDNVFERGALRAGETLLVHGGASGIGTMAIQLGKAFGAKVLTTVGSEDKAKACRELGADLAINYKEQDFVREVLAFTSGNGANVILDMIGGDYVERNYQAAAMEGRIVQIAFMRGPHAQLNLLPIMAKRLTHTGSFLRPRSTREKALMVAAIADKVLPIFASGTVRPVIDSTFPFTAAADAHRRLEAGAHIGKLVLTF